MSKTKELKFTCGEVRVVPNRYNNQTIHIEDPNLGELFSCVDEVDVAVYVAKNFEVDAVFSNSDLGKWAEDNGYIKQ